MIEHCIVVTDPQIAVKANRYANDGFFFTSLFSPVKPEIKYKLITFSCQLGSEAAKAWGKELVQNCLDEGGTVLGIEPELFNLNDNNTETEE